jgi:adenylylsulfate kinase
MIMGHNSFRGYAHKARITKKDGWGSNDHRSALIWITGLSASEKSSIASESAECFFRQKVRTFVLTAITVRHV